MPRILAFDQSLNFAYAVDRPSGDKPMAVLHRLPVDGEDLGLAFAKAEQIITDAIAVHQPDEVWLEQPIFVRGDNIVTSAQTMRILLFLAGEIEKCAYKAGLPTFEVGNMVWKKFFVGTGHAKKWQTIDRCIELSWGKLDNNCADACGIWAYAKAASGEEGFQMLTTPLGMAST